jgi:cytochrome P450
MALLDVLDRFADIKTTLLFAIVVLVLTAYASGSLSYSHRVPTNAPPQVKDDLPVIGALGFWTRRWDWWSERRDQSKTGTFSFHAGPNMIVALSGDKGRQLFFESKDLGFGEGYAVLFGATPKVSQNITNEDQGLTFDAMFHRRLIFLLKNEQFRRKLPILISDTKEAMEAIKNEPSGRTDPFESLYRIIFRLTIRMLGAAEIADDPQKLEEALKMFEMIDSSATATSVMFPKFPSPALLKRSYAGARLYMMIDKIIKKRAASGEKHDDALQYLLDQGDRAERIVQFVVGALFAGLLNSGINVAWVSRFRAAHMPCK